MNGLISLLKKKNGSSFLSLCLCLSLFLPFSHHEEESHLQIAPEGKSSSAFILDFPTSKTIRGGKKSLLLKALSLWDFLLQQPKPRQIGHTHILFLNQIFIPGIQSLFMRTPSVVYHITQ